jgi:hypothetical protein
MVFISQEKINVLACFPAFPDISSFILVFVLFFHRYWKSFSIAVCLFLHIHGDLVLMHDSNNECAIKINIKEKRP